MEGEIYRKNRNKSITAPNHYDGTQCGIRFITILSAVTVYYDTVRTGAILDIREDARRGLRRRFG